MTSLATRSWQGITIPAPGTYLLDPAHEKQDPIFFWARLRRYRADRRSMNGDAPPQPTDAIAGRFVLAGELTIKGTTRQVDLQVEFGGARRDPYGRDIFGFSASTEIDRENYGLVWNVLLDSGGVLVGTKVQIELAGEAIRQS